MTYKEKAALEYPDLIDDSHWGGVLNCPDMYDPGCRIKCEPLGGPSERMCTACWNREIPEEENSSPHILDSGKRREFETGAVRDIQEGKGRCDLLPLDLVVEYLMESGHAYNHSLSCINQFKQTGATGYLFDAIKAFSCENYGDSYTMLLELSKHFEEGAKKYGENNWQKGIPVHCYIDSAIRHLLKFLRGDTDEPHDRAFCWNLFCAIWTIEKMSDLDDYTNLAHRLVNESYDE